MLHLYWLVPWRKETEVAPPLSDGVLDFPLLEEEKDNHLLELPSFQLGEATKRLEWTGIVDLGLLVLEEE